MGFEKRAILDNGVIYIYIINYICSSLIEYDLVGGFKHFLLSIIYGIILPIDELIFFKMVKTTNQIIINHH